MGSFKKGEGQGAGRVCECGCAFSRERKPVVVRGHPGSGYGKRHCMRKVQVSGMQANLVGPGQKSASSSEGMGHHILPDPPKAGTMWSLLGGSWGQ